MSFYTPLRVEADQKEIIINQLKGEVYNLKKNEQDYYYLEDQFKKLEQKYKILLDDKSLSDSDFRSRHEMALRNVAQLKTEADALRAELRDRNLELGDLDTDGNTLKTQLDQRNIEIQRLKTDINSLLADSEELLAQRARLEQQFAFLRADKAKMLDELKNLEFDSDSVRRKINDLEKYLNQIDNDGKILRDKILQFENDNNSLDEEVQGLNSHLNDLERQISEQQKQLKNLHNDIAGLKTISDKNKSQASHFLKATQIQLLKNSDLSKTLSQAESALRTRDGQISQASKQVKDIDIENQNLCDLNSRLEIDLEELQKHLENVALQNSQLLVELERYSAEDEVVRNLIDRRPRVLRARARVQQVITISRATTASPIRQSRVQVRKSKIII